MTFFLRLKPLNGFENISLIYFPGINAEATKISPLRLFLKHLSFNPRFKTRGYQFRLRSLILSHFLFLIPYFLFPFGGLINREIVRRLVNSGLLFHHLHQHIICKTAGAKAEPMIIQPVFSQSFFNHHQVM